MLHPPVTWIQRVLSSPRIPYNPVLATEGPETRGHGPNPGELSLEGDKEVLYFLDPMKTLIIKYFISSKTVFLETRNTRSMDCKDCPDLSKVKWDSQHVFESRK